MHSRTETSTKNAPVLAAEVIGHDVRELVVREEPSTAVGAEIALGALERLLLFVFLFVDAVVLPFDGVHVEVPYQLPSWSRDLTMQFVRKPN